MHKLLRTAIELHGSGRLDEAVSLDRQVLTSEPDNAEAHWLGVLHIQAGDSARAVALIGRAVILEPVGTPARSRGSRRGGS
jgi:Flp pilus assembly protein TadD